MIKTKFVSYTEDLHNAHLILLKSTDDLAEFLKDFTYCFNGSYLHHPSLDSIPIGKPFIFEQDDSGDYHESRVVDLQQYRSGSVSEIVSVCKEIEQIDQFCKDIGKPIGG